MARTKEGIPFHPSEYDPDSLRVRCITCGKMNSCNCENHQFTPWYPRLPILMNGGMIESVVHDNGQEIHISEITTHSLQRIVDCDIKLYPTRMMVIENFIEPSLFSELIKSWPSRDILKQGDPIGRFQTSDVDFSKSYRTLYNEVINNEYIKYAVLDKLGLEFELNKETKIQLWEDTESFKVNDVHVDFDLFDITFGLYMPEDDSLKEYGTEFWSPNQYVENLEDSFTKNECDFIFKIPFIPNIIYFIPRGNKSWHSSPDILTKLNRKHLYGYYGKK